MAKPSRGMGEAKSMTKTEMEIKLKELEGDVLRLRLEVARLEREVRSRPYVPYVPRPIQPHEHPREPWIREPVLRPTWIRSGRS